MKNIFIFYFTIIITIGCSSGLSSREKMEKSKSNASPQSAAVGMDLFWTEWRDPEDREFRHWEYYYKHCTLQNRKPYPDRAEYMCTEPY